MAVQELERVIHYIARIQEDLEDGSDLSLQTEIPILRQTGEALRRAVCETEDEELKVLVDALEFGIRRCIECCVKRLAFGN